MKLETYNEIVAMIQTYSNVSKSQKADGQCSAKKRFSSTRDILPEIGNHFSGVSPQTLGSILSQEYQKKMRKSHHHHYQVDVQDYYYHVYLQGVQQGKDHIILSLAEEVDLSAAQLARIILEKHLSESEYNSECPPRPQVTRLMKEPCLIEDPLLAKEVHECLICDDHYGSFVDCIKHSVGHEYECKLKQTLDDLGLTYIDEDQMRDRGYDKTPDCKLEVPIAVDGHVVNWIESKASFGDEYSHKAYLKDQFWSYWNRFGPGMVIYWFGFIEELDVHQAKGIILRDRFPENIVTML